MDWTAVATFVAGLAGGYTIKSVVDSRSNKISGRPNAEATGNSVAQSGNVAGGHLAGGNIKIDPK
jgi:hypothetical protein